MSVFGKLGCDSTHFDYGPSSCGYVKTNALTSMLSLGTAPAGIFVWEKEVWRQSIHIRFIARIVKFHCNCGDSHLPSTFALSNIFKRVT